MLDTAGVADYQSVIGYFAQTIMKDLRLVSGYDVLYGKVKAFVQTNCSTEQWNWKTPNTLRNLSELAAARTIARKIQEGDQRPDRAGQRRRRNSRHASSSGKRARSWPRSRAILIPKKSVFNRIIGDSGFELAVRPTSWRNAMTWRPTPKTISPSASSWTT